MSICIQTWTFKLLKHVGFLHEFDLKMTEKINFGQKNHFLMVLLFVKIKVPAVFELDRNLQIDRFKLHPLRKIDNKCWRYKLCQYALTIALLWHTAIKGVEVTVVAPYVNMSINSWNTLLHLPATREFALLHRFTLYWRYKDNFINLVPFIYSFVSRGNRSSPQQLH